MGKQVKVLENHTDILPDFLNVSLFFRNILSLNEYSSAVRLLKQVNAPQNRRFSRTGRANESYYLSLLNLKVNSL